MATMTKESNAIGDPCVCPQCMLDPDEVEEGGPVPRRFAPNRIKCPACPGIVMEVLPGDRPKKPPRHPQGLDTGGIWACFMDQKRIVKARKSSDSTGEAKPLKPARGRRFEQEPPGFKERLRASMERVGGFPKCVKVSLTREQDVYVQSLAARYRCDQSTVIKAAVRWFLKNQPAFDKPRVRSSWKSRRPTTVKLSPDVWRALHEVAIAHEWPRTGKALSMILDYCRRKRIDPI